MVLAFRAAGTGAPTLMLHGIGSSSLAFGHQLSALADELAMVAWDAPGYAASSDPDVLLDLDGYVDRAAALARDRFGDRPVHLVGVSWGGVLALRTAASHPELVRSLTVIGASLGSGVDAARAAAMRERSGELLRLGAAAFARQRGPRLLSPDADAALVEHVVATMAAAVRPPGYARAAEAMAAADLSADLGRITAPTLVLAGAEDRVTGPDRAREIAALVPGSALVLIPGAGHLANQERPALVDAWLRGFTRAADLLAAARTAADLHERKIP
ncbi:alpha/beta fold hydrolase [Nocardioides sp. L-11A]|uniref:alpha/beta fold hydrolase n=1 Tax=Nocardioides sp. L-11A TaxID=3043848 RepID=UPI00249A5286|nr:alpha/beta fold hydrolase [Nocardioides sp. L-11A]